MKIRLSLPAVALLSAQILAAQCPPLGPIQGTTSPSLCGVPTWNYLFHIYSIPNAAAADLVWTLSPATGQFVASINTGPDVTVNFDSPGPTQLCATPTNPCYDPTPICIDLDVRDYPYADPPTIQRVCHGEQVYHEWTGDAEFFTWRVSQLTVPQDIGQPPGQNGLQYGTVDFIAKNTGNSVIHARIVYGAWHHIPACGGFPAVWYLDVYPRPTVTAAPDITVCGGSPVAAAFTGNAETFNWTNDNPAIGLPASGTGNIAFTSVKAPQTETAQITVTPANAACDGDPVTFTITVQGSNMDPPPDITVCDGDAVNIPFSGNASEYDWTSSNPAIGLDAAGSG
ncbi:MAG: hypothetical protein ACR2K1_06365, partial [Saprospiraceae bacterium]